MEVGISSFPLLNLPNGPLKCVLQNMDMHHQIGVSILSKKSKEIVKSLYIQICKVEVIIGGIISIFIDNPNRIPIRLYFYTEQFRKDRSAGIFPSPTKMYTPDFLRVDSYEDNINISYEWKKQGFEIKEWIDHFLSIFNHSKVDKLCFRNGTLFDLDALHKTIINVAKIEIDAEYPAAYNQKVVQTFTSAKKLILCFDKERRLEDSHNILCLNFDVLELSSQYTDNVHRAGLNDLLVMNSRSIRVFHSNLSPKDVNKFLRHWMNGSNQRMKHMALSIPGDLNPNKELILNGLNHRIVPPKQGRLFENHGHLNGIYTIKDGYDIKRNDGTTATIAFHQGHERRFLRLLLEVFVWH